MPKPTQPDLPHPQIVHVQQMDAMNNFIITVDRLTRLDELIPIVFPGYGNENRLPNGAFLDHEIGSFTRFRLIVNQTSFALLDKHVQFLCLYSTPADMFEAERLRRKEALRKKKEEKWWNTFHPILGMTPRERLNNPGWSRQRGFFIWSGHDPHFEHSPLQFEQISVYESVNTEIEFYLAKGLSLQDSMDSLIALHRAQIRAAILSASGFDDIGMELLDRQAELDESNAQAIIERELSADAAVVESALRRTLAAD